MMNRDEVKVMELRQLLAQHPFALSQESVEKILEFYGIIQAENERQNLTRLLTPSLFFHGHVEDVLELLKWNRLQYPSLDLGSGVGVPGILAALISSGKWVLAESEKRKADYLARAVVQLELQEQVQVYSGRAENFLKDHRVNCVVVRAVGSLDRIYPLIRKCSTWNNLILFKGPAWKQEWESFQKGRWAKELVVQDQKSYLTGPQGDLKERIFLKLARTS